MKASAVFNDAAEPDIASQKSPSWIVYTQGATVLNANMNIKTLIQPQLKTAAHPVYSCIYNGRAPMADIFICILGMYSNSLFASASRM